MKIFSGTRSDYDEKIISDNRYWECRLEFFYLSWRALTASLVKDFTLSDYVSDGSNISMGSVAGGKLTVNLSGASYAQLSMIFEGAKIRLRLTLMDSVMLRSKTFIVDQKKINRRRDGKYDCTLTAFDVSYEMTDKYKTSIENPTCVQIVTEIANKYDLTVNESVSQAVAAIDGDTAAVFVPLDGFTCKQTLGYMAGCYGCYASINEDSEICFEWYSQSSDTIAPNRIFEGGEYISEMEQRTIKMIETGTQGNQIVAPSNANGYSVNFENPYISQSQATAIYNNKISGDKISFRTGKLKYKGSPLNNPGTIVTVEDIDGNTATFYIMKRTLNFDGGLSETIECQGESDTAISYKVTSPIQQKINRALSQMEEAIKAATGVIKQTQGSTFELIADETDESKNIGFKLYYKDSGDSSFDDCVIMATAGGIGFSTNKGESFDAAAIYFYKDDSGNIHGCINGEFIKAGSISADKINTNNLIISKGNVDGLEGDLSSLSSDVSSASQTATNAAEKANSVGNALTSTNSNVSSLTTEQENIINVCLTEGKTQINGGNIATGSILTGSLAANSVTTDKLSVGVGLCRELFFNCEFESGTQGWIGYDCSISSLGASGNKYINAVAKSSKNACDVTQYVYLEKGKKYRFAAQVCPLSVNSFGSNPYISVCIGSTYKNISSYYDFSNSSIAQGSETVINYYFTYDGTSGLIQVGLAWKNIINSGSTACDMNIAWMSLSETNDEKDSIYCSRPSWLKSDYRSSRVIDFSSTSYIYRKEKSLLVDSSGNMVTLGKISSSLGNIGSLYYTEDNIEITNYATDTSQVYRTHFKIHNPDFKPVLNTSTNFVYAFEPISTNIELIAYTSELNNIVGSPGSYVEDSKNTMNPFGMYIKNGSYETYVTYNEICSPTITQTSTEAIKRSVSPQGNVLKKLKESKIYEYFLKDDSDNDTKKIGFIIEKETPKEIISKSGNGINLYSMASMNWKATQEILERLENLENEVKNNAQ